MSPGGVLPNPSLLPAKRVRREEEEQGNERSFRRQAETETSGLCDDEPPWAKSLAARTAPAGAFRSATAAPAAALSAEMAAKPPCVNDTPKTARRGRGLGQLLLPLRGNLPSRALQSFSNDACP